MGILDYFNENKIGNIRAVKRSDSQVGILISQENSDIVCPSYTSLADNA